MAIDTLRLFTEVAHTLSFTAVAQAFGVNTSLVWRTIGALLTLPAVRTAWRVRPASRALSTESETRFLARSTCRMDHRVII